MSDYVLCSACERPMRPRRAPKRDHPGTVAQATTDTCHSCYSASERQAGTIRVDMDGPCVLVRADLRPSTYRVFAEEAKRRGVGVGDLLSLLADRAVPKPRGVPADLDKRIRELNAAGLSDNRIARAVGVGQATVSRHRKNLGLTSPTPRPEGAGRKAKS